jgi:hypothetical protein
MMNSNIAEQFSTQLQLDFLTEMYNPQISASAISVRLIQMWVLRSKETICALLHFTTVKGSSSTCSILFTCSIEEHDIYKKV